MILPMRLVSVGRETLSYTYSGGINDACLIAGDSKPDSPHFKIWASAPLHKVSLQALVRGGSVKRLCRLRWDVCLKAG